MSLLLEALKKAELAKQAALAEQRQQESETTAPRAADPDMPASPLMTRERLPDISTPLEIRAEDFAPAFNEHASTPSATPQAQAETRLPPSEPQPAVQREPAFDTEPQRDAARQLFEVKEVDYNPRRPFYITVSLLVAIGVGYGVYVWWQLQPRYTVNPVAARPPGPATPSPAPTAPRTETAVSAAQNEPSTKSAPAAGPATAPANDEATGHGQAAAPVTERPAVSATRTKPPVAPAAPAPAPIAAAATSAVATSAVQSPARGPATDRPARPAEVSPSSVREAATAPPGAQVPVTVTPSSMQVDETLEKAYAAYERGDLDTARGEYQKMLARDPNNRDALLGLAAIDVRTRNFETAELRYLRLLELDPRDSHAQAALIALNGSTDPVQSESRIKNLIAHQPEATHLHFVLGNQYAAQGRWREAQEAYFKSYSAQPDNADFAYNLAVSLDHIRQPALALEYYRRALELAVERPATFDRAAAERRARELAR